MGSGLSPCLAWEKGKDLTPRVMIVFAEEAGVAVVPALHDVQGQTVKMRTATTWHTKSVSWADEAVATGVQLSLAPFYFPLFISREGQGTIEGRGAGT
jgi:hypothetical protein